MKVRAKGLLRGVSTLALAGIIALTPLHNAAAASSIVWGGATDFAFGTASNWVGGVVPDDGDTIVFDSSDAGVTAGIYDTPAASLTNGTGARPAGLNATGLAGDIYAFNINTLRVQANAQLKSSDYTKKTINITSLQADGDVTLDAVHAAGGTFAGNVTFKNWGGNLDAATLANFTLSPGKKIILGAGMDNVTITDPETLDGYTIQVDSGAMLTLTASATAYLPKIILNGGFVKTTGTAVIDDLTLTANSKYWIVGATSRLLTNTYTPSTFTMTAHDSNEGIFQPSSGGTGNTDNTNNNNNNGGNNNNNGGNTDNGGDVPGTPDTAFHAIVTNPLTAIIATIAIIAATGGIVRLQRNRR